MTLSPRLTMALMAAVVALRATAAPIEFTQTDFEQASTDDAPPLTVWFEADNVYLKRLGEIDLDAPLAPVPQQAAPTVVSVPEPVHYKLLLTGAALLLLVGARRRSATPWGSIKVGQPAD
jgi:hypothetical protein